MAEVGQTRKSSAAQAMSGLPPEAHVSRVAEGQKTTLQGDRRMSALPLEADIYSRDDDVCFGPVPEVRQTLSANATS